MFCRSLASDGVDQSSDVSSAKTFASELSEAVDSFLRFLDAALFPAEALAHFGTGCNRSNWHRSRLLYSFPLIRSSDSAILSFRSLGLEARETTVRSSSLSTHAAVLLSYDSVRFCSKIDCGKTFGTFTADGDESRKNNWKDIEQRQF